MGEPAHRQAVANPEGTTTAFKRKMGKRETIRLRDRELTPEQLSAFLLQKIVRDAEAFLGEKVEAAVVTVAAYFDDNQRSATKCLILASQLGGGLEVPRGDEETLTVKIPAGAEEGMVLRVPGKGQPPPEPGGEPGRATSTSSSAPLGIRGSSGEGPTCGGGRHQRG